MYEEHTIQCSSCGKLFTSKENETVCNECYKEIENISNNISNNGQIQS